MLDVDAILKDEICTTFHLERDIDETGISGVGRIAEGYITIFGGVCMEWLTETSSTCFYQNIEDVRKIHGHNGKTRIVIHDN